ncbi:hypothetical protein QFC20_007684 [Naganishia adeliensis]|uniref:Uncharacterized protein n=1 Tax=Naganishia adeliensis TaxID=92952 RepID=A0ACC2UW11_9TREE|nr:hypothetical protein QFC20_007684 [Naganishia adeliensis]
MTTVIQGPGGIFSVINSGSTFRVEVTVHCNDDGSTVSSTVTGSTLPPVTELDVQTVGTHTPPTTRAPSPIQSDDDHTPSIGATYLEAQSLYAGFGKQSDGSHSEVIVTKKPQIVILPTTRKDIVHDKGEIVYGKEGKELHYKDPIMLKGTVKATVVGKVVFCAGLHVSTEKVLDVIGELIVRNKCSLRASAQVDLSKSPNSLFEPPVFMYNDAKMFVQEGTYPFRTTPVLKQSASIVPIKPEQ